VDARIYFLFYLKYVFMYNLFEKKCKTKKFSAGNGWQLTALTDSLRLPSLIILEFRTAPLFGLPTNSLGDL
jgi:hypothetical protein